MFLDLTRGPMGHILDTGMSCFTFGLKLGPCCHSLEKHMYFPGEHFLIKVMGVQYNGFYLEQYSS